MPRKTAAARDLPVVPVQARDTPPPRSLRSVQRSVSVAPRGPKSPRVASSAGLTRASQAKAFEKIATRECRDRKWGYRHLVVGSSGSGKTYWAAELMRRTVADGVAEMALVHDGKDPTAQADYLKDNAAVYQTADDLRDYPPDPAPSVFVIHSRDKIETPDGVATLAGEYAAVAGLRVVVVVDEIYDAMKARQTFSAGTEGPTSELFRKGRSRGISIVVGTQVPQTMPTDVLDLADTIAIGRLKRRSLAYAARTWELEPEMVEAIRRLERGQFVLLDDSAEWDRTIYGPG